MGLYHAHVVAQYQKNPCLFSLERFLSEPNQSQNSCRIASINFVEDGDGAIRSEIQTLQAEDLEFALSPIKQTCNLKGRILIVEDISRDVVELLGSSLNIDPFFFASHVYAPYRDIKMQTPDLAVLPSRYRHQQYFNTHYHRTVELPQRYEYLRKKRVIRATNISRKLAVLPPTHNTSIGLVQHALSIHMIPQKYPGDYWLCLILVDTSMPNGRLWLRVCDKGDGSSVAAFNVDTKPFLGGYEDFLAPPNPYTVSKETWEPPSRQGMLEDLIYYWNQKWPDGFIPTAPSLLSLSFYPLKIIAAEWVNVLAVMNYHMKRYEYSIEGQKTIAQDLDRLNTDLNSLQRWRRRNLSSQQKIDSIRRFITSQMTKETEEVSRDYSTDSDFLIDDFTHLTTA